MKGSRIESIEKLEQSIYNYKKVGKKTSIYNHFL